MFPWFDPNNSRPRESNPGTHAWRRQKGEPGSPVGQESPLAFAIASFALSTTSPRRLVSDAMCNVEGNA